MASSCFHKFSGWIIPAGFTLAELLIALAILGELATFTIPKGISSQRNGTYNAVSKEAISMVSQAYQLYTLNSTLSASTTFGDMTSYINYVQFDTTRTIDSKQTVSSISCAVGSGGGCLILHNGGALRYNGSSYAGTTPTNALEFIFDPNGTYIVVLPMGQTSLLAFICTTTDESRCEARLCPIRLRVEIHMLHRTLLWIRPGFPGNPRQTVGLRLSGSCVTD